MSAILKPKMKTRWVTADVRYVLRPYHAQAIPPVATGESERLPSAVSNDPSPPVALLPDAATELDRRRGPIERLDAFLDRDFPPLDWRVERLLPAEGFAVLLGKEKSCKTCSAYREALECGWGALPWTQTTKKGPCSSRGRLEAEVAGTHPTASRRPWHRDRGLELYPVLRDCDWR